MLLQNTVTQQQQLYTQTAQEDDYLKKIIYKFTRKGAKFESEQRPILEISI